MELSKIIIESKFSLGVLKFSFEHSSHNFTSRMAFVPASTSSVKRVGTGPAIRSPSQRVASIGHCARQIVGTLSLNRKITNITICEITKLRCLCEKTNRIAISFNCHFPCRCRKGGGWGVCAGGGGLLFERGCVIYTCYIQRIRYNNDVYSLAKFQYKTVSSQDFTRSNPISSVAPFCM